MNHSVVRADVGNKARWYHFQWATKSVITGPSGGQKIPAGDSPDYRLGLVRWGAIARSKCPPTAAAVGRKRSFRRRAFEGAYRFTFDWAWDGEEAVLMSRSTDEIVTFSRRARSCIKTGASAEEESKKPARAIHFMPSTLEGGPRWSVHDAMFS